MDARFQRFDESSDTAAKRLENGLAGRLALIAEGTDDDAAVALLVFDEFGEHAGGAEFLRGTSVNTGEQGFGEVFDGFGAEMVLDEGGDGAVRERFGIPEDLEAHADFGAPAEQIGPDYGHDLGGDHHLEALGKRHEAAVAEDVGAALRVVGTSQVVTEPDFADELLGPGLGGEPAFRAGFEDAVLHGDGADGATGGRVEDGGIHPGFAEVVRARKAGDATANDADSHRLGLELADHLHDGADVFDRRFGQDAVTEVEDMAGADIGRTAPAGIEKTACHWSHAHG